MSNGPVPVRRAYIDGRFGQMHVRIAEPETPSDSVAARPLMCFHLNPFSGLMFETWLGEIGRDRIAIAVDTPGYGSSDSPSSPPPMAEYAGAMGDVADALAITELDLLGFHTGGRIAVQLALLRPETVKHIVLAGRHVQPWGTGQALRLHGHQ